MKKTIMIAAIAICSAALFSCKKEKHPVMVNPVAGTKWTGYYRNGSTSPDRYYMFSFFSQDSILVNANDPNNPSIARGTWKIVSDSIRATYTYTTGDTYSIIAKNPQTASQLSGTWGTNLNIDDGGIFLLNKN